MTIMAVELSATRLLAPYFGTSNIIWTVVIGMIMIALSLGNFLGGRAADKYQGSNKLFYWIWIAAIWIALIPLAGKYVIALTILVSVGLFPNQLLISGSILSCLLIFTFPLVILGMASPYLVKLGIKDLTHNGRTTGIIYALSTIGSIIGTFIPTFITIPAAGIGTSKTFLIFALIMNLLCLCHFLTNKKRTVLTGITAVLILGSILIPFNNSYAFWKQNVLEDESAYNYLQVYQENGATILTTNVAFGIQSLYRKGSVLSDFYYDYLLMAPFFQTRTCFQDSKDVLILGLGAGTYAKECRYFFPNSRIDGVDIDPKIITIAKKYFDLTDHDAHIYIDDGRAFLLSKAAKKYDLVIIDAYHDISIPFHMATREFFDQVKKNLKPEGIVAVNINIHSEKNPELINYFTQTIKSKFNKVYRCDIHSFTNTMVIASDDTNCRENFLTNINQITQYHPLSAVAGYVKGHLSEVTEANMVLTDEVAPVELMGQKVLDEYVGDSLGYLRNRLRNAPDKVQELLKIASGN
jgi:Spermidine synthase